MLHKKKWSRNTVSLGVKIIRLTLPNGWKTFHMINLYTCQWVFNVDAQCIISWVILSASIDGSWSNSGCAFSPKRLGEVANLWQFISLEKSIKFKTFQIFSDDIQRATHLNHTQPNRRWYRKYFYDLSTFLLILYLLIIKPLQNSFNSISKFW